MSVGDDMDRKEMERQKLLEEIRRRAEAAEIKRIEEEEESALSESLPHKNQSESKPEPEPVSEVQVFTPPPPPGDEHRLIDLRGKFAVAIDRRDVERASEILLDLAEMLSGTVEIESLEKQFRQLKSEVAKEVRRVQSDDADRGEKKRKSIEKRMKSLLEQTKSLYEQEKYDRAAETVSELLGLDPENEEAMELQGSIGKARELAAELRAEEDRRNAEAPAHLAGETRESEEGESETTDRDFWGSKAIAHGDFEFGLKLDGDDTPEPPKIRASVRLAERISRVRIPVKPILLVMLFLGVIVLGYFVADRIRATADQFEVSLLLLPGWHSPADSMAEYLSYALTEQVTQEFSRVRGLRIIAPTSSQSLRYIRGGPAAASRSLGVQYYLHWSIKTTPVNVTFDLTLRDTTSAEPIWSERRQSSIRELGTAVREIAGIIADRIGLPVEKGEAPTSVLTNNPDAMLSYFKGRFILGRSQHSLEEAGILFREAMEADPDFVDARIAYAWTMLRRYEAEPSPNRSMLETAGVLLSEVPITEGAPAERYLAGGLSEMFSSRYENAHELLEAAVIRWPGDAGVRRYLAVLQLLAGEADKAVTNARLARDLDPLNQESHVTLGFIYSFLLDHKRALEAYMAGSEYTPERDKYVVRYLPELLVSLQEHDSSEAILSNEIARARQDYLLYYRLGRVYQSAGKPMARWEEQFSRSLEILRKHLSRTPDDAIARSYLALVLTRLGKQKEADSEIGRALREERDSPIVLYNAARAYAVQKKSSQALEYLDKAITRKFDPDLVLDLDFFNLRQEDGFLSLVTR